MSCRVGRDIIDTECTADHLHPLVQITRKVVFLEKDFLGVDVLQRKDGEDIIVRCRWVAPSFDDRLHLWNDDSPDFFLLFRRMLGLLADKTDFAVNNVAGLQLYEVNNVHSVAEV